MDFSFSFIITNQIIIINYFFSISKFWRPFFNKFIKYTFLFKWYAISFSIKILSKNLDSISCFPWFSMAFSVKTFHNGDYVNLVCSITLLLSEGSISLHVRYSFLSIYSNDNADIFATSLLISYRNCSSLILLSIVIILPKKLFVKCKRIIWCKSSINE